MTIVINGMKIDESTSFNYISNPKRAGSKAHGRYGIYESSTTYAEYVTACEDFAKYAKADLRYDTEKGHLSLLDGDGEAMTPNLPVDNSTDAEVEEEVDDELVAKEEAELEDNEAADAEMEELESDELESEEI